MASLSRFPKPLQLQRWNRWITAGHTPTALTSAMQADETVTVKLGARTLVSGVNAEQLWLGSSAPAYEVRLVGGGRAGCRSS